MATASPIFDAQTRLVDQQNERIVQQHKMIEIDAARPALEQQIAQTRAAYEHQVLNDLSDAEKKVAEFSQDLVKAEQKVDEQILRSPIDGTVQQLSSPSAVSRREFRGFRTSGG
jgi:hemolysin D